MRLARARVALIVTAATIGLTPAAYADPTDPTLISGLWDDDDFDDTVIIIAHASAIVALAPVDVVDIDANVSHGWPPPVRGFDRACPVGGGTRRHPRSERVASPRFIPAHHEAGLTYSG